MTELNCKNCLKKTYHRRSDALFCSDFCRDMWHRIEGQQTHENNIPQSGVRGVSYCTKTGHWKVKHNKLYICMKKYLTDAVKAKERHTDIMIVCRANPEKAKKLLLEEMEDAG